MIELVAVVLAVIFLLGIGLAVLMNGYRSFLHRDFFFFTLSVALWAIANHLSLNVADPQTAFFWIETTMVLAVAQSVTFFLFINNFPERKLQLRKILFACIIVISIITSVLAMMDLVFVRVDVINGELVPQPGPGMVLFVINAIGLIIAGAVQLVRKIRHSTGMIKNQLHFIFAGFVLMFVLLVFFNFVLVNLFQNTEFIAAGPLFVFPFIIATAYAMIRHHLLDIRVVIKRSLIFSLLVVVIAGIYSLFVIYVGRFLHQLLGSSSDVLISVVVALLIVLIYNPLYRFLEKITDHFLFRGDYHSYTFLSTLSKQLGSTLQVDEMVSVIDARLDENMRIEKSALFLHEADSDDYFLTRVHGWKRDDWQNLRSFDLLSHMISADASIIDLQTIEDRLDRFESRKDGGAKNSLTKNDLQYLLRFYKRGVCLVIPLIGRDELVGLLFVGEKKSGDLYRQKDIETLQTLASQAALALVNARLYQNVYQFSNRLKHEIEEATATLAKQNRKLTRLDRTKSEFMSIASHQLRTPLTSIKGYLSMIQEGDYGKVPKEFIEPLTRVRKNTDRLVRLVEDLLDLTKIEQGRLEYTFAKIDITKKIESIGEDFKRQAEKKGIKLEVDVPDHQVYVMGDQDKLHQVFVNLIDNSLKYTEKGSVSVSLQQTPSTVVITVKDTGIGITDEDQERIFQKFVRGAKMSLYHAGGTGIGLYLAKQVVLAHNGIIDVMSEGEGKGSTFTVRLPLARENETSSKAE